MASSSIREEREAREAEQKLEREKAESAARIDKFFCAALTGLISRTGFTGPVNLDLVRNAWAYAKHAERERGDYIK